MRAAYAAEDAGEIERALALMYAALDELDPRRMPRERIEALILKVRTAGQLDDRGRLEPLQEAIRLLPDDADAAAPRPGFEMLARRTMLAGDIPSGIEFARQADRCRRRRLTRDSVTANAWITFGTSLAAIGQEEEGLAEFERVSHLARSNAQTLCASISTTPML